MTGLRLVLERAIQPVIEYGQQFQLGDKRREACKPIVQTLLIAAAKPGKHQPNLQFRPTDEDPLGE